MFQNSTALQGSIAIHVFFSSTFFLFFLSTNDGCFFFRNFRKAANMHNNGRKMINLESTE